MKSLPVLLAALSCLAAPLAVRAQPVSGDAPEAPKLTDANIAAIVLIADDIDVKNGQLAVKKTKNTDVSELAGAMARDHAAMNDQAIALAGRLHLQPVENDLCHQLRTVSKGFLVELGTKQGAEFDRLYVSNEVAYHQTVIHVIEAQLIPSASNPDLKRLLETVLPILKGHLTHAMRVQQEVKAEPVG